MLGEESNDKTDLAFTISLFKIKVAFYRMVVQILVYSHLALKLAWIWIPIGLGGLGIHGVNRENIKFSLWNTVK